MLNKKKMFSAASPAHSGQADILNPGSCVEARQSPSEGGSSRRSAVPKPERKSNMLKKMISFVAVAGLVLALAPAAQADILAELRADYDAGLTGIVNGDTTATHTFADTATTGHWDFSLADGTNPTTATTALLPYRTANTRFQDPSDYPVVGGDIFGPGTFATLGPDEFLLHPGDDSDDRTVMAQWTAGAAYSDVSIVGEVRLVRWGATATEEGEVFFDGFELFIYHNGTQVGSTITVVPLDTAELTFANEVTFSESISTVADGDTITFSIDRRARYIIDDTGLVATISGIPEPATMSLLAISGLGVLLKRRRRRA